MYTKTTRSGNQGHTHAATHSENTRAAHTRSTYLLTYLLTGGRQPTTHYEEDVSQVSKEGRRSDMLAGVLTGPPELEPAMQQMLKSGASG